VAEGGAGGAWQAAFAAAEPGAVRGTIGGLLPAGPAAPRMSFLVDSAAPTRSSPSPPWRCRATTSSSATTTRWPYRLFDAAGQLQISSITLQAREIWDAGSEVFDPAAAAFVGNNDLRTPQNSVVAFNFAEFWPASTA
jgi:hypothetical protein